MEEDIDELIRERVEERLEQQRKEMEERLKEEKEQMREEMKQEMEEEIEEKIAKRVREGQQNVSKQEEGMSRRSFLKKAGLGAVGLGVLGLGPVSALDVRDENLNVFTQNTGSTKTFSVTNGGGVELLNGNFNMNNNNITSLGSLNGADIQNASSGTVPTAQGDGTLAMADAGGGGMSVTRVSSNSITNGSGMYLVDTSGGSVTLTLSSTDVSNEESIAVINVTGSNAVTIDTEGSETIDPNSDSSKTISAEGKTIFFNGDGSNWDAWVAATDSELSSHASSNSAHHSRYSDGEARGAVRNKIKSGSITISGGSFATILTSPSNPVIVAFRVESGSDLGSIKRKDTLSGGSGDREVRLINSTDNYSVDVEYEIYEIH